MSLENLRDELRRLTRTEQPPPASANSSTPTTKLALRQRYEGVVLSSIGKDLFNVRVAGMTVQMHLPKQTQSGETMQLEVIATRPNVVFGIASPVDSASPLEQISTTAKILFKLADLPIANQIIQQMDGKAIWHTKQTAPDSKVLARALRDVLSKSGLFYESHQVQWMRGERSTQQLLDEPQNAFAVSSSPPANQGITPASAESPLPITKELLDLVQQQLHTLENHHLIWSGLIWPEQFMQWKMQGDLKHSTGCEDEREWYTELELNLPHLGDVQAQLHFRKSDLNLTLYAVNPATVERLSNTLPNLTAALTDAGITLISAVAEKS